MTIWSKITASAPLSEQCDVPDVVENIARPVRPARVRPATTQRPRDPSANRRDDEKPGIPAMQHHEATVTQPSDSDLLASVLKQTGSVEPSLPAPARAEPVTAGSSVWALPGFDRRCRVSTNFGELPIEALRRRDMVKTLSGAYREVKWIDVIRLDADFMARHPQAHPIRLRAKSFGAGAPARNMLVSPGQVIHTKGSIATKGNARAAEFEGHPSICRMQQPEMTYYRFHCGQEETVCIDGAWFCVSP